MTVNSVSSATLSGILTSSVSRMQCQLTVLEVENSTGRLADIGLSLGAGSGATIVLHQQMADFESLTTSNAMVASQLDCAYNALTNLTKVTSAALATSIDGSGVSPSTPGAIAIKNSALGALESFSSMANAGAGSVYVFAGQNFDTAPMKTYTTSAQASVEAAFATHFGFTVTDPQVNTISGDDLRGFLEGDFASLFTGANWTNDWSSATDEAMTNRVDRSQTITTSVSANDPAFQNTAKGLVMLAAFGGIDLSGEAFNQLVTSAQTTLNTANNQMTEAAAAVGTMQSTVEQATSTISLQKDVLTTQINAKETVDSYRVATEVTALQNQLQVAFSLTAQLHKLSLVNFL